jgi:hypothetical protein
MDFTPYIRVRAKNRHVFLTSFSSFTEPSGSGTGLNTDICMHVQMCMAGSEA